MYTKKNIITLFIGIVLISCQKEKKLNPFEISTNRIGHLTNVIKVNQLDSIYASDSIVKRKKTDQFITASNEIEIFEKGGAKLLILEPREELNPESTIETIQIIDPRYHTDLGLSADGVFMDIKNNYKISKINNTLSSAVIFIDSIQAYLTIDKKELPSEFKFNTDTKIEAANIPDSAKIKHFLITWDEK
ncbi:hypothetical protein [Aquimarina sp. MMG016]|uniref:hypothetical protein n=1 Tax=Aquimarina sp. MMG016 TaxID=2822690 RepID=UPI001B3A09EB|nr:hypothetical protein [Aquimarina sp. MMG016]MBQ4822226.1 hypothetical protein [Aquimarina sp. MMG016]